MAWLDRFDPLTWKTPEKITPVMRVWAAVILVVVLFLTFWVPLRMIGVL